jgi:hypothetical protein
MHTCQRVEASRGKCPFLGNPSCLTRHLPPVEKGNVGTCLVPNEFTQIDMSYTSSGAEVLNLFTESPVPRVDQHAADSIDFRDARLPLAQRRLKRDPSTSQRRQLRVQYGL